MYTYKSVKEFFHTHWYIDRRYRKGKPAGYCHCAIHRGYLTVGMIKQHKCKKKKCRWYQEYKQREGKDEQKAANCMEKC